MKKEFSVFVIVLLSLLSGLNAQTFQNPRSLSGPNEFPQNMTNCFFQDHLGYLWVGMSSGLTRYDGYEFKHYIQSANDSVSILNDPVHEICEDSEKRLWVGTRNGLFLYDRLKDCFENYNRENSKLADNYISSLTKDSSGNLWVATSHGITHIHAKTKKLTSYHNIDASNKNRNINTFSSIAVDDDGMVWCGTKNHGVLIFNPETKKFTSTINEQLLSKVIVELKNDKKGYIWIAYFNKGLSKHQISTKEIKHYNKANGKLPGNSILHVSVNNGVYVGTDGNGLLLYNSDKDAFSIRNTTNSKLFNNRVSAFLKDKDDNSWVGYANAGVDFFSSNNDAFKSVTYHRNGFSVLKNNQVSDIMIDHLQQLWIANDYGGIISSDSIFLKFFSDKLIGIGVSTLFEGSDHTVYIGTYKSGLFVFNREHQTLTKHTFSFNNKSGILGNDIRGLTEDKQGNIWMTVHGKGISRFNPQTSKFRNFIFEQEVVVAGSSNWNYGIHSDSENKLWIGSTEGLYYFNFKNEEYAYYKNNSLDTTSIHSNVVFDIVEGPDGNIWMGTNFGLEKFNKSTSSFEHVSKIFGLNTMNVLGLEFDQRNNLWFSTNQGLFKLNFQEKRVERFNYEDGLQGEQFNIGSKHSSTSGHLYFGGTNGYTYFHPDSIERKNVNPNVLISSLKINNEPIGNSELKGLINRSINETTEVILSSDNNSISLSYLAINFDQPESVRYAYQLAGIDKGWVYADKERTVNYNFLPPGDYIFKVKSSMKGDEWLDNEKEIYIHIQPPFWRTWWAYILYFLCITLIFFFFKRFSVIEVNKKNELLLEQLEKDKIEEVYQSKLQFFTDISHEIRTPLTLIIDPIDRLVKEWSGQEKQKNKLLLVKRNTDRILKLINQLLDFRKIEAGHGELFMTKINLQDFLHNVATLFEEMANEKKINFIYSSVQEDITIFADKEKLEKVIMNLLSNAFKHTDENGTIIFGAKTKEDKIKIEVKDTGRGISKDKILDIFKRYVQDKKDTHGSGIGLALSKRLVELHNGTIDAKSDSKGTSFVISFSKKKLNELSLIKQKKEESDLTLQVPIEKTKSSNREMILLIEDDLEILSYLSDVLINKFEIITAKDGLDGLDMAKSILPDLIISDVMMPNMDGNQLSNALKTNELTNHIPIILLTARTETDQEKESLLTGADVYLKKPVDTELLILKIKNILKTRERHRQLIHKELFDHEKNNFKEEHPDQQLLLKVKDLVEQNLDSIHLSIDFLAQELGLSRTQLFRKFKALLNDTPKAFIQTIRIQKAEVLLNLGAKNITEIAFEVGYSDVKSFSRSFKNKTGFSPQEYRKRK